LAGFSTISLFRRRCVTPVGLMYGVYIPLAIIVILAILLTVLLR
jgi:hypothetical protein